MVTEAERQATERRKRVEKYFIPSPEKSDERKAQVFLGIAAVLGLLGLVTVSGSAVGVLLILGAGYVGYRGTVRMLDYRRRYRKAEPKPSDQEMDKLLEADLADLETRALNELGILAKDLDVAIDEVAGDTEETKRPVVLFGPHFPSSGTATERAIGKDLRWRFSRYDVMVLCPTKHNLGIARTLLDFQSGTYLGEETGEYQYTHVGGVRTATQPGPDLRADKDKDKDVDRDSVRFAKTLLKTVSITIPGDDNPTVTVGITDERTADSAELVGSGIHQVVDSVRRVLRDKGIASALPAGEQDTRVT